MKTELEIVTDFLEEDQKYQDLVQRYQGNADALAEADWMYQDGVRVSEIERVLLDICEGEAELSAEY